MLQHLWLLHMVLLLYKRLVCDPYVSDRTHDVIALLFSRYCNLLFRFLESGSRCASCLRTAMCDLCLAASACEAVSDVMLNALRES